MSSFVISALCAASMCYTPSELTRQSNSFVGTPGVQHIVAGSTYQISVQGTSFAAGQSWTLSSTNSLITTPTCTYSAEATNNQCTWSDEFTASTAPGTTITFTAHDSVSGTDVTFSMITVSPVPSQPSLATSTETQYVITPSNDADLCVLIGAPSSYTYELDLPSTWSSAWTTRPAYLRHVAYDNLRSNPRALASAWESIAAAGEMYDFHAVCYNTVGQSVPYSVYNLVAVGSSTAPAAQIVSAASTSANSFRVVFKAPISSGARGFYPNNVMVVSTCRLSYGQSVATMDNVSGGQAQTMNVNSVDLSVDLPFSLSCTVAGVVNTPVQGRIDAVASGLSSSSGSYYGLSSSSAEPVMLSSAPGQFLSSSSAEVGLLSSSSSEAPVLLSSTGDASTSTGAVEQSSTGIVTDLSSSSGADVDISTGAESSSMIEASSGAAAESSSAAAAESSSAAAAESSSAAASESSSAAAASSTAAAIGTSSSSSSSANVVVSPISDIPEGTVSVTFSIDLPDGIVTEGVVTALQTDIASNIAVSYNSTTAEIKPFIIVTVGTMTSARRLLTESVSVSFMVLGNITSVTGGEGGSAPSFNALAAATSVSSALSSGTFVSTETATFGISVPQQTVEVLPVVSPQQPSSSTGSSEDTQESSSSASSEESSSGDFGIEDDSSSNGVSDGAIAGAVVGSVVGAIVLFGIVAVVARSGGFNKCMTPSDSVAQANANDIVRNKGPLPITSFEENVEMGEVGVDQPVRIHTDSPVMPPMQSPATLPAEEMVYNNDANDVQVEFETRE